MDSAARLLLAGTPRQVLARILPGDPLDLRSRCAERLRARAQFVDVDRVLVRSQARIARAAASRRMHIGLEPWLDARIEEAIDDVRDEAGLRSPEPGSVFQLLAQPLGLSAREMARACKRFNALEIEVRRAFFELVVEGLALERAAEHLGRSALEVARDARLGLNAFLLVEPGRGRGTASPSDSPQAAREGPWISAGAGSRPDPSPVRSTPTGSTAIGGSS